MTLRDAQAWRPVAVPGAILLVATLVGALGPGLPPSLAGVRDLGPYVVLVPAALVSLWFNRGRAFVAALSLLAAYAGHRAILAQGDGGLPGHIAYTAIAVLLPLNVLVALVLAERGALNRRSLVWVAVVALEALLVASWAAPAADVADASRWRALLAHWSLRSPPMPLPGRLVFAAAFAAAVWRAWPRHTPLEVSIAGALAAFFVAFSWPESPGVFAVFVAAAGAVLMVGLLQESHRLAFRDELTGLPSRRALDERMRALGGRYVVAMVDVDHFKAFNDTHGHDVGDQVLRLVAARLREAGGGGRAYRYGGEEFTVLFADRRLKDAMPYLEALRASIEGYEMTVRGEDRPKDARQGSRRRGRPTLSRALSVTVSIGAAEPTREAVAPALVIKAADEALYRAKAAGRNRVAR